MIQILAALSAFAGFAALALSMKRHQRDMIGRKLSDPERYVVRLAGWLAIAASLTLDMIGFGPGYGAIVWFGHLSIAAWMVVAALCWRARLN